MITNSFQVLVSQMIASEGDLEIKNFPSSENEMKFITSLCLFISWITFYPLRSTTQNEPLYWLV